jgi:hypothetical protein
MFVAWFFRESMRLSPLIRLWVVEVVIILVDTSLKELLKLVVSLWMLLALALLTALVGIATAIPLAIPALRAAIRVFFRASSEVISSNV